jgi:serine/threonine-protein kinase
MDDARAASRVALPELARTGAVGIVNRQAMLLPPGARVDRYEILELLGSGGMGEVYRARDPKLARTIALKVLRVDRAADADGSARLLREARAVAALTHPNVLAVFDVGEIAESGPLQEMSFIAMELVVGHSLRTYIGDPGVPLAKRVGWLRDVASALAAAHEAGIVHRDVKPENVMVRFDGVVKVLDFGIARRTGQAAVDAWASTAGNSVRTTDDSPALNLPILTGEGSVIGTPQYMAPEQLRAELVDARADQFAWGIVAYQLLVGRSPWPARDAIALLTQIVSYDPPPPHEAEPAIPDHVSAVVVRALSKRRDDRFASMNALIEALDGKERAPAPAPAAAPPASRAAWWKVGAAVAAALSVGGAIVAGRAATTRAPAAPTAIASAAASATATAAPGCSTNAECVRSHGGEPWHCNARRHECVAVASEDCQAYAEPHDAEADDVVWFGGLYPVKDAAFDSERQAADLARRDFAAALGPSAARKGPLHARPIALAMCDESADEERAARHLVDDLEVPAVLGFRSTPGAIDVIPTVLMPSHCLSVVTISQAPELTRIPARDGDPRLVWRTTLDREASARPLAKLVSDVLEPSARRAGLGNRPLRVAAVVAEGVSHQVIDDLFGILRFNGQTAVENGANFRQFVLDADAGPAAAGVIDALADFAPQVVYFATSGMAPSQLPVLLEARWRGAQRPAYITGSGWGPSVLPFVGRDASRRRRFFSAVNVSTRLTNAELVLRYNMAYPRAPIDRSEAPQPSYDGFYLLAYAAYASPDGPLTGDALAKGIERLLPPARKVGVGPGGIFEALTTLRNAGRIDLDGAIGSLDFDPATGEAPIDYAITCLGIDDKGMASPEIDSGLVYDATEDALVGSLRCP